MSAEVLPLAELVEMDAQAKTSLRHLREAKWRRERSAHTGTCRGCTVEIDWVLTTSNPPEWMPLDKEPAADGTVAVIKSGVTDVGVVNPGPDVDPGGPRRVPHWATCIGVDAFRRRHRERRP
ncbi:hypothetical protein I6A60_01780 [Frankia sp. AgB1.9]|uniref:hypothetical protein n=1 Tax=unclassified Frankia TaxID=2632575 RepID=UPI0019337B16|nr:MULTISPECIES: hypothetical protein [unclassified Frankia]MBL7491337.1 hypothetical protein [Frankia sp. AgW1.1]MBL7546615.1 hypothetical protein [Frankia sp. AgB1.9]MBL7622399.1 hypothetical protein [Frankia sp. AgB1.8]